VVFAIVGLLYNPLLVLIALFIWISAAAESAELQQRTALSGVPVNRLMARDVRTLAPDDTLTVALEHVLSGFQHDFPVVEDAKVTGVLTQAGLLAGLARRGAGSLVNESMEVSFQTTDPDEPVNDAIARLRKSGCRAMPVVTAGKLCGLLTTDTIAEFVMIDAAIKSPRRRPPKRELEHLAPSV
jgi:stage IV sporulation protein FB